jgi:Fe2+ or Zn2+ uptake regulation protein
MSCEQATVEALRGAGVRCTTPRLHVAAVLRHAGGHLTAEAIHEQVAALEPGIALSTVYRTLETLKDVRMVSETDAGSSAAFEWIDRSHRHSHLRCVRCGREVDLDARGLARLERAIRESADFEVHFDHLAMTGLCGACRGGGGAA